MSSVYLTYGLIREMEEKGLRLIPGTVLTYRENPRFPWFHCIFDLAPGTRCRVIDVEYDACEGEDYDSWDNHYHYHLEGLEEHGGICTTELFVLFDCADSQEELDEVGAWMMKVVEDYRNWQERHPEIAPQKSLSEDTTTPGSNLLSITPASGL